MIFDKPNSVDLLEAISHFLNTKIKSEVPAHLAFKIRIIENVLNIVIREIEKGDKLSNEVMTQLQSLIETDEPTIEALALLIKDEKIDLEDQDLKKLLVTLSNTILPMIFTYFTAPKVNPLTNCF